MLQEPHKLRLLLIGKPTLSVTSDFMELLQAKSLGVWRIMWGRHSFRQRVQLVKVQGVKEADTDAHCLMIELVFDKALGVRFVT
jgi:hypothetical protein